MRTADVEATSARKGVERICTYIDEDIHDRHDSYYNSIIRSNNYVISYRILETCL